MLPDYFLVQCVAKQFEVVGCPTSQTVLNIPFDALRVMLREKHIITTTQQLLKPMYELTVHRHGAPSDTAFVPDARRFLAAYMIVYRQTQTFESIGSLENALINSAAPLIKAFEKIRQELRVRSSFEAVPAEVTEHFPKMLFEYEECFKAWKESDDRKRIQRIKHALTTLYFVKQQFDLVDEPEDSRARIENCEKIEQLITKFEQLAGREALLEFNRQHISRVQSSEVCAGSVSTVRLHVLSNEEAMHEVLFDPTFQLNEHGGAGKENPMLQRISEFFSNEVCNSLVNDLKLTPPCYARVLNNLAKIRETFNYVAGSQIQTFLDDTMNLEFIKQQAAAGLYDWKSVHGLLVESVAIIRRFQATKRKEETESQWKELQQNYFGPGKDQQVALCKGLQFLSKRVNLMQIDLVNDKLRRGAQGMAEKGVEYERSKFQENLAAGRITLRRTTTWLENVINDKVDSGQIDIQQLVDGHPLAYSRLHLAAMWSIITHPIPIRVDECPETLLLDAHRLSNLQTAFRSQAQAAVLAMTTANAFRTPADGKAMADIVGILNVDYFDAKKAVLEIHYVLQAKTSFSYARLESHTALLRESIKPTHAVYGIVVKRLAQFWDHVMCDNKAPDDLQMFGFISARIVNAAREFKRLVDLNRAIHLPTYNRLIAEGARKKA